jgi:acetolactate synthase I/II/III large subunit
MRSSSATGGQLVVDALRSFGVHLVFGVPGGQTLAIMDALLEPGDIRFVTMRHEGAAACAADAVGRVTRRPGTCLATTGPGATNLLTGVGGAFRDSSPMIVMTCNNNVLDLGRDDAQAADHVDIFRPLVKRTIYVGDTAAIPQAMEEAYVVATAGSPGPVLVDLARNALESSVDPSQLPRRGLHKGYLASNRPAADETRVAEAATLLAAAKAPVVWLGNGALCSDATDAALILATRLDAPVITTFNGMGGIQSEHRLAFGPKSRMGTSLSAEVLDGADVLLAVGNSLNAVSTNRWRIQLPDTIIQVDIVPEQLGRYYASRTLGLLGDAQTVMTQLAVALSSADDGDEASAVRRARLARLGARRDEWRHQVAQTPSRPGSIAPDRLVRIVREVSPDDTVLVVDAGNPGVWTHLWEVRQAGTYLKPVGFGNMGFALPAAIGVGLAQPASPVLALVGDGSMAMTMAELETVAREGVAPCVVVMNDSSYGNIRQEQSLKYRDRTIGVDFGDVDFAAIARACGVDGVRVDNEASLRRAVASVLASRRPAVIDARIDRERNAWTYGPFVQLDEPHSADEAWPSAAAIA